MTPALWLGLWMLLERAPDVKVVTESGDSEEALALIKALWLGAIEVRAFEDGRRVVVEVADTGPGIPEGNLPHVFEELYRGENARGVEGSGLGLALVRAVAQHHGGNVTVRSREGEGTAVTLRLPLAALTTENARLATQVATMATPTAVAVEAEEVAREKTAGWQIHRNKKHGYFFMYPLDCFYGPMPVHCKEKPPEDRPPECLCFLSGENPDDIGLQAYTGEKSELTLASFSVYCDGNPDYFAPPPDTELIAWLKEKFSDLHTDIPDEPNMEIGGLPAVRIYAPQSSQAYSDERIYFSGMIGFLGSRC